MKYFFDTEFDEDATGVELISIGIVSDDGREFYAVNNEYDQSRASPWLEKHVIPQLFEPMNRPYEERTKYIHSNLHHIAHEVHQFCPPAGEEWSFGTTEFWAYYGAYDWYLLCRLMGGMLNTPKGWPYYFKDIIQLSDHLRIVRGLLPPDGEDEHNALADARWNKTAYDKIKSMFPFSGLTL